MSIFMFLLFWRQGQSLFCHNRENEIKEKCGNSTFCSNFDPASLDIGFKDLIHLYLDE